VVPRLPWAVVYALGDIAGAALYHAADGRRQVAVHNLTAALGSRFTPSQRQVLARRSCQHLLKTLLEFVRLPELTADELRTRVPLVGAEHLAAGLSSGRGVILVTPHLGNWEYLAARVALAGFPLSVIGRDSANPAVAREVTALRRSGGVEVLSKARSLRQALNALQNNRILGILPDQHAGVSGMLLEFFGRRTPVHPIPALLARRTGAPLVVGCAARNAKNELRAVLEPPLLAPRTADRKADVAACMREMVDAMERQIRRHPDQWLWMHKRFRDSDESLAAR
jgi:KDO2-lipid IV(A) lauroyltransferase